MRNELLNVTEFSLFGQKLYLSPVLDLYSEDIIVYTIYDEHQVLNMITEMLEESFKTIPNTTPILFYI